MASTLVFQPVTTSAWPVRSWFMSAPILTMVTWSSAIPLAARSARSRMTAEGWVAMVLPIMSCGVRIGFLPSER
ncbi:hypothetical protein D9M68_919910 [compost metagenome]